MSSPVKTAEILIAASDGDRSAADQLMPLVYDELRALAAQYLRRERSDHTLQATALVHEAYIRMIDQTRVDWKGRSHFFAIAARMIRRILVDHARRHATARRGGGAASARPPEDAPDTGDLDRVDLLALDEALEKLRGLSERQAQVVEIRFFGGLTVEETAEVLDVSPRTVRGDWFVARAWLHNELA